MERRIVLELKEVEYRYNTGTVYEMQALKNVSLTVCEGDYIALVGHTGSGKSTLVQILNGLLKPTGGSISFYGEDIHQADFDRKSLRGKVGLVFQYPEHQLFETDVLADVCFGPKNMGLSNAEAEEHAREALELVGLREECYHQSPFMLSGGERRRAALAGILAMKPEVLVLDEPTAGLDPMGREEVLRLLQTLHEQKGMTIILVSHSMEEVARVASRVIVMEKGRKVFDDVPREVFRHGEELQKMGLALPQVTRLMQDLKRRGYPCGDGILTVEEAVKELARLIKGRTEC